MERKVIDGIAQIVKGIQESGAGVRESLIRNEAIARKQVRDALIGAEGTLRDFVADAGHEMSERLQDAVYPPASKVM